MYLIKKITFNPETKLFDVIENLGIIEHLDTADRYCFEENEKLRQLDQDQEMSYLTMESTGFLR